MVPKYKQKLKSEKPKILTVANWSDDNMDILKGCFECTDWDVLMNEDLKTNVNVVTEYINFCVNNLIAKKEVKCYPNNKPWVTKELKIILNEKKKALAVNDKVKMKEIQKQIKSMVNECIIKAEIQI